jgi:hypothetical protein
VSASASNIPAAKPPVASALCCKNSRRVTMTALLA